MDGTEECAIYLIQNKRSDFVLTHLSFFFILLLSKEGSSASKEQLEETSVTPHF